MGLAKSSMVTLLFLSAVWPARAQERAPVIDTATVPPVGEITLPETSSGTLTGKERLGKKWMDEQRIDNCNVPLDKRGSKPRPDSCPEVPMG